MNKHFEMAGIKDDPAPEQNANNVETSNDAPAQENQQQPATPEGTQQGKPEGEQQKQTEGQPAQQPNSPSGGTDGQQQPGQKSKEQVSRGPQDLTLPDGSVVKAGMERRWYETAQTQRQRAEQFQRDLNTERQQREQLQTRHNELLEVSRQIGLEDPTRLSTAVRLYKDLQANPVATVKQLLVDLKAGGYNIDEIGSGVDTAAIQRMIDQRLPNASVNGQQGPTEEEINQQSALEAAQFLSEYPDAVLHEPLIAELVVKNPGVSIFDAYSQLKLNAINQGFDWSQPLLPQIEARANAKNGQQGQQPQAQQSPQQQQQQPAPIGGRNVVNAGAQEHDPNKILNQADDFGEAIRQGMRDAGITIN